MELSQSIKAPCSSTQNCILLSSDEATRKMMTNIMEKHDHVKMLELKNGEIPGRGELRSSGSCRSQAALTLFSSPFIRTLTLTHRQEPGEAPHQKKENYNLVKCFLGILNKSVHHHFLREFRNVNNMVFMNAANMISNGLPR